jgi:chromosome segregation ATPase
VEKKCEEL